MFPTHQAPPRPRLTPRRAFRSLAKGAGVLLSALLALASCSSTSGIPDGEQLYTGLKKTRYLDYDDNDHFRSVQEEVEAALAAAPNGAMLGSSYYRTPFPLRLWVWNFWHDKDNALGRWMTKSFGKAPVLMSNVNPALRASVAQSVLRSHGYFNARVDYEQLTQKNPKEGKIQYDVHMNHLFTLDTIRYVGFPQHADSIIAVSMAGTCLHQGDAFDVTTLDQERRRVSTLFRDSGYYYYQPGYASYLADTIAVPGKVQLRLQMADSIPEEAKRQWYIGKVELELRKSYLDSLTDTLRRGHLGVYYWGRHVPLRPGVILRNLKLRPRQLFSYSRYTESLNQLTGNNLFSSVNFMFTPRDSSATCDTLDLRLRCLFDKPYDFYVETNLTGKTTGWLGPGIVVGFTKRNAFRGGETFDLNLFGSYEWQTGHKYQGSSSKVNSYEYGMSASLEFPRLVLPGFRIRRRWHTTPSTVVKASSEVINRAGYFKRHVVSGELTYKFQPSAQSMNELSPLTLQYDYMTSSTADFDSIRHANAYLDVSMRDQFIPKMRYRYTYTSPLDYRNPIYVQATLSEAGNLLSLGNMAFGNRWRKRGKELFKNPYAQFFKAEVEYRKTWQLTEKSQLVGHAAGGVIWSYGNSTAAPYVEQFYVGGANSIRAFNIRSIGPGSYTAPNSHMSYLDQTGDLKLLANIEYRFPLVGSLYGATFVDAGNVWTLRNADGREGGKFKMSGFLDDLAVGTGIGLRYDLDYFVIRVDWGIGIHAPYDTGKRGYYNMPSFRDSQTLHIAVGYPF